MVLMRKRGVLWTALCSCMVLLLVSCSGAAPSSAVPEAADVVLPTQEVAAAVPATATAEPTALPTLPPTLAATATASPTVVATATEIPPTPTPPTVIYTVAAGDTLFNIAQGYGIPLEAIVAANGLADPNSLQEGDVLEIPLPTATPGPTSTPQPTIIGEDGAVVTLPPPTATPTRPPATTLNGLTFDQIMVMSPEVQQNVREIYAAGQALGRNPNHFSKLGDSTSLNPHFLARFDTDPYNLGDYVFLQPTIDHYRGAFGNYGIGLRNGLHAWTVFDPFWANKNWCVANEHILQCEIRVNNPSVMFIRLGSNDSGAPSLYEQSIRETIEYLIDNGVIPIVATKADRFEGSDANNEILRRLAAEYQIPVWEFDQVAATLPGRGLGDDNIHIAITTVPHDYTDPIAFQTGHPMQDLAALIALDELRQVLEN